MEITGVLHGLPSYLSSWKQMSSALLTRDRDSEEMMCFFLPYFAEKTSVRLKRRRQHHFAIGERGKEGRVTCFRSIAKVIISERQDDFYVPVAGPTDWQKKSSVQNVWACTQSVRVAGRSKVWSFFRLRVM